jgi:hypothetical protein
MLRVSPLHFCLSIQIVQEPDQLYDEIITCLVESKKLSMLNLILHQNLNPNRGYQGTSEVRIYSSRAQALSVCDFLPPNVNLF